MFRSLYAVVLCLTFDRIRKERLLLLGPVGSPTRFRRIVVSGQPVAQEPTA